MRHYWLPKGERILRFNGAVWVSFVTTLDAYYTEDNLNERMDARVGDTTRINILDKEYQAIQVDDIKLRSICRECRGPRPENDDICRTCDQVRMP